MQTQNQLLIRQKLRANIGSFDLYNSPKYPKLKYSEGIIELIDLCKCQWLITDVLSVLSTINRNSDLMIIHLSKTAGENNCYVSYHGDDGNEIYAQNYQMTDFPLDDFDNYPALTLYCNNDTLYLPSEH